MLNSYRVFPTFTLRAGLLLFANARKFVRVASCGCSLIYKVLSQVTGYANDKNVVFVLLRRFSSLFP